MKILLLFLIVIITALFFSCQSINGPVNPKVYLPLNIGNYWVYEVNSKDSITDDFNSHIDSMVVIGTTQDSLGEYYEVLFFRDGFIYDTMKMRNDDSNLQINTQAFHPFIPLDTGGCQTSTDNRWLTLALNNNNKIHKQDTVKKEDIIFEGVEVIKYLQLRIWDYDISKSNNIKIYIDNNEFNTTLFSLNGKEYFKIIIQSNIPVNYSDLDTHCEITDDGKTMVRYTFYLNLYYQEGIGIIQSTGVMNRCDELFSEHTRKLLSYKVN